MNASNAISQKISSETIFVTMTFCKPPVISFLGRNNIKVSVWHYVYLLEDHMHRAYEKETISEDLVMAELIFVCVFCLSCALKLSKM